VDSATRVGFAAEFRAGGIVVVSPVRAYRFHVDVLEHGCETALDSGLHRVARRLFALAKLADRFLGALSDFTSAGAVRKRKRFRILKVILVLPVSALVSLAQNVIRLSVVITAFGRLAICVVLLSSR